MNSEKVKEIKECLKNCINDCNAPDCPYDKYKYEKGITCIEDLQKDCLTLINDLESENERLNKALVDNLEAYKDGFSEGADLKTKAENKLKSENHQLKDRIAELEMENDQLKVDLKNSIDMQEQMLDGFKTATKEVEENLASEIPDLLKQFAER